MQRWPLLAWLLPLLPFTLLIGSRLQPERRLALVLQPGVAMTSEAFQLEGGRWGAPRLNLQVQLPANSSASYDVDLLDGRKRPLLELSKEAWREVTAWKEEGESGIEDISDTTLHLELKPRDSGPFQLRVELQDLLDGAGRPLPQPLMAVLRVRNHVLDTPLLLLTAVVTTGLVSLAMRAFSDQGRQRIRVRRDDRHLDCRMVMGGSGLVRMEVRGRYEGGLSSQVLQGDPELDLLICDAQGRRIQRHRLPMTASRRSRDGNHWWTLETRVHLRFTDSDSRRLRVVLPYQLQGTQAMLEWGEISVLDGCRVLVPQPVLPVVSQPG